MEASQTILRLTNEDRASNLLLEKYQQGQPLSNAQKQELAGLLNQYGYELQTVYGYSPQKAAEAIQGLVAGKAFVASTGNTQAYNEALSYLKGASVQSGQAAAGTEAALALPGGPGMVMRGVLAISGAHQTGTGIGQVIDGEYSDGALNIGLGTAAIFGGAGNKMVTQPTTGIVSPTKVVSQESSRVLDPKTHTSIPKVTAELTDPLTGKTLKDTNQGNRPDYYLGDASRPTLINDIVQAKIDKNPNKKYPNGNMATTHAEVGAIQQAYEQGLTQGRNMELTVKGDKVCDYCRSDVVKIASKAGLKSLTIYEKATGNILYWKQGMRRFTTEMPK